MQNEMDLCKKILADFIGLPDAEAFLAPVPWKEWNLDDYPRIIKQPMDLGTVNAKMLAGDYKDVYEFAYDMRLIWRNCCTYNQEGADIYDIGKKLSGLFEERFSVIDARIPEEEREPSVAVKRQFVDLLYKLSAEELAKVVQIINEKCESALDKSNPDLIDIIVDAIDNATFHHVFTYVKNSVKEPEENKMEVEPN